MNNKRVKSGLIVFGSTLLSALVAVVPTVEFANFTQWLQDAGIQVGIPSVVVAVITAVISQLWFAWRNKANETKGLVSASRGEMTPY